MLITLATDNLDKLREFRQILPDPPYRIETMRQRGFKDKIEETGRDFEQNSLLKASAVHQKLGGIVLADDSGLAIDVLDGAPGIYSARFAGESADYPAKISKIYQMLAGYPPADWHAHFICVITAILPDGRVLVARGQVDGKIAPAPRGTNGFGYDPIFFLPELDQTMAELVEEKKNCLSHRGRALRELRALLDQAFKP